MAVQIVIDGQPYPLPPGTDPDELRRRVAQAVFRCEVEQLHLADGRTMLVNWRSVRLIEVRSDAEPQPHPEGRENDAGHERRPVGDR
ncbi:hypothetical protein FF36_04496 [Frankia torreyi]|uniref:Uncharacterized protein n=1 Tax=Frankia torreyi TaxID=1856 RepID=A0A0D8BAD1_9ACTN|nr:MULTISPECIES: hypothetical protein [Frankia]KJE21156.1 hypothetical protein FF36_04496 [Frankia torreyi]